MELQSLVFLLFIVTFLQLAYFANSINEQSTNCPSKYARETTSTNECICMSRNCEGPKCQSGQGFVWYNFLDCPTCQCIAPDKEKMKLAAAKREAAKQREKEMGKIPVEDLPKFDYSDDKETPATIFEWLEDNSRVLFAIIVSLIALIIFGFIILANLTTKATATSTGAAKATKPSESTDNIKSPKDDTASAEKSVTKDNAGKDD